MDDVVKVIRCKNCARRHDESECPMCVMIQGESYDYTRDDGYCDRGELPIIHGKCKTCIHSKACEAWIRHGKTLYDDFQYDIEDCPYYTANLKCGDKVDAEKKRMTCKEKFIEEHPGVLFNPGSIAMGCPEDYGYSFTRDCFDDEDPYKCEKCWNREVLDVEGST